MYHLGTKDNNSISLSLTSRESDTEIESCHSLVHSPVTTVLQAEARMW